MPRPSHVLERADAHATLVDFPDDPESWQVKDVYMFGPTMLAAPVTDMGARNRTLYLPSLPSGQSWEHYFTKKTYIGGANVTVAAPLDEFPLFSLKTAVGRWPASEH